jgi:hypothetical protein
MNVECTNNGGFSGELHHPNELSDAQGSPGTLSRVFARSKNPVSSLPLLRAGESCSRTLPEIHPEGVGSARLFARLDLQLRQRNTGMQENLHPLYGEDSAAYLQPGGNSALHHWGTLPCYTERNRRLRSYSSESYKESAENPMNASIKLSMNGKTHMILTSLPFVLRLSKDERKIFSAESTGISNHEC